MAICDHCNEVNPDGNRLCMLCGAVLKDQSADNKAQPAQLYFEVKFGEKPGQRIPVNKKEMIIGRHEGQGDTVDIDLTDQESTDVFTISRRHARIIQKEDELFVEDLNSTNGTFVNVPEKLQPGMQQKIIPGDVIAFGDNIVLKLRAGDI